MKSSKIITWSMWTIASIFYAYQYLLRVMPSIMMDDITQQFNISAATYGQFSGVYYIGYALMHLPLGILLHKFGPKKVMPICILITVAGLTPIIFSTNWIYPVIGRALMGIGSSAAILGVFNIIRFSFSEDKFTKMLSYSVVIGLIGAIYGGGPINYMCSIMGYKDVVTILAILGVILSIVTYLLLPNFVESKPHSSVFGDIMEVVGNYKILAVCLFAGLMVGPLEGFADVWGSAYLKNVYGIDQSTASTLPSIIFLGMGVGAPILSLIAEKTKSHVGVIISSAFVMFISFIVLLFGHVTLEVIYVMFFVIGVCSAYQIIAIYKSSTYAKDHVVNLTTSFANMVIMIFGYFFHSIIGYIVSFMGGATNTDALKCGIMVIPITLAVACIGYILLAIVDRNHIIKRK
jgi:predicted MFS family arabinose efflux permease